MLHPASGGATRGRADAFRAARHPQQPRRHPPTAGFFHARPTPLTLSQPLSRPLGPSPHPSATRPEIVARALPCGLLDPNPPAPLPSQGRWGGGGASSDRLESWGQ